MPNNIKSGFFISGTFTADFSEYRKRSVFYCNAQFSILTTKYRGTKLQSTS